MREAYDEAMRKLDCVPDMVCLASCTARTDGARQVLFTLTSNHKVEQALSDLRCCIGAQQSEEDPEHPSSQRPVDGSASDLECRRTVYCGGTTCQGVIAKDRFVSSSDEIDEDAFAVGLFLIADPEGKYSPGKPPVQDRSA